MYARKTRDEYVIMSNWGYGWDEEVVAEDWKDATRMLREYRENCPRALFRIHKKRVPKEV